MNSQELDDKVLDIKKENEFRDTIDDYEYQVGYDDYKLKTDDFIFFTVICNTFDKFDDSLKYMREQQERMPDKAIWIRIVKKGRQNEILYKRNSL